MDLHATVRVSDLQKVIVLAEDAQDWSYEETAAVNRLRDAIDNLRDDNGNLPGPVDRRGG